MKHVRTNENSNNKKSIVSKVPNPLAAIGNVRRQQERMRNKEKRRSRLTRKPRPTHHHILTIIPFYCDDMSYRVRGQ